jgi:DNA polymerase III alpha subunit
LTGIIGDKVIEIIREAEIELKKDVKKFTWLEILLFIAPKVNSTAFKALASIGFFRGFNGSVTRNKALYDYEIYRILTKSEQAWLIKYYETNKESDFVDALKALAPTKKEGGGTNKVDRKQVIENEIQLLLNPPYDLEDDPSWIIDQEIRYLGCPVSMTKVETSDTSAANTTCKEIVNGKKGKDICIVANIQRISDYVITKGESKGQTMSFLTIEDDSCILDSVIIFPKIREKYKYILYQGNNLIFCGSVGTKDSSLIIEKIHEL